MVESLASSVHFSLTGIHARRITWSPSIRIGLKMGSIFRSYCTFVFFVELSFICKSIFMVSSVLDAGIDSVPSLTRSTLPESPPTIDLSRCFVGERRLLLLDDAVSGQGTTATSNSARRETSRPRAAFYQTPLRLERCQIVLLFVIALEAYIRDGGNDRFQTEEYHGKGRRD